MGQVCIGSNYLHCSHIRQGGMGAINIRVVYVGILVRNYDDDDKKAWWMEGWDA
jgi:hypothetical protein